MFLTVFWRKFLLKLSFLSSGLALFLISFYKAFLSGSLASGGACRFYPSCSDYASLVYKRYSFPKASFLVLKRLLDCRPFGPKVRSEPEIMDSLSHPENPAPSFHKKEEHVEQ